MVFSTILFAQQITLLEDNETYDNFTAYVYEDPSAERSLDEVIGLDKFQPSSNHISNGYTKSAFWFRFIVVNKSNTSTTRYFTVTETFMDTVQCYIVSSDGNNKVFRKGVANLSSSHSKVEKPVFPLTLQAGESKTVYIRITSKYPMFTSIQLMNDTSLQQFFHKIDLFYAFYFGALVVLLLYNLSIYVFLRESAYLYYILFGSSFLIWQLTSSGFFPFDSFDSSQGYYLATLSIPLFQAFLVMFSRSILDTKKNFPTIDLILRFIAVTYILLSAGILIDPYSSLNTQNALAAAVLPFLFFTGVKSYMKGNKTAVFYLIAQVSFLSTGTIFALAAYGILEYTLINRYALLLGSFLEMVLFSLALAYKIKLLEQDKVRIYQRMNEELEAKVKERTSALEESKKQLEELANKDALTDLYNRRFFFEIGGKIISASKREYTPLSVIMFDIDHFKTINDTYGHAVGDHVLRFFAEGLKKLRDSDVVARIGGEEFVVLCQNTDQSQAMNLAEGIRKAVSDFIIETNDNSKVNVTVSAGVSTLRFDHDTNVSDMLLRADDALYEAKKTGRNRVVAA
jgi:diguanylate cyclase (GGDEF)-like protein